MIELRCALDIEDKELENELESINNTPELSAILIELLKNGANSVINQKIDRLEDKIDRLEKDIYRNYIMCIIGEKLGVKGYTDNDKRAQVAIRMQLERLQRLVGKTQISEISTDWKDDIASEIVETILGIVDDTNEQSDTDEQSEQPIIFNSRDLGLLENFFGEAS
jgi:hypothetical protein